MTTNRSQKLWMITPHKERFVDSCFRRACPMLDRGNDRRSRLMESTNVIPAKAGIQYSV
ncbi:MAG: hypothetical protein MUP21_08410 [Dehalococcoidia bacterium]|nr:hypothetical protein [Dehalococcoidia bacterium]